jgi:hypothetical protein
MKEDMQRRDAALEQVQQARMKIAREEMGGRIRVTLNRQTIRSLGPGGEVPCPKCGRDLTPATAAVQTMAELIRENPHPGDLIRDMDRRGGFPGKGSPAIYTGVTCPHCQAGFEMIVQVLVP